MLTRTIDIEPNHHGLAIVVPIHSLLDLTDVLTKKLRFDIYVPRNKRSLKSYMQAVDLELKHHPIIVVVSGDGGWDNHLYTDIGVINIKEDIMAPLFPPIATHLADNPKIFLFIGSNSHHFERHDLHFMERMWENYIVGYIACDDEWWVAHIVKNELASSSLSVQEIFTSISHHLPYHRSMTVIDRLKNPVYLHPLRSELMVTHSRSQGIVTCL